MSRTKFTGRIRAPRTTAWDRRRARAPLVGQARAFDRQDIAVELQQVWQSAFVTRHLPMHALLVRIAPAGMHPNLSVHAGQLSVEGRGKELEVGIRALRLLSAHVVRRLLHLD